MILSSGSNRVKVVTIVKATELVLNWAKRLPSDFDLVIGIPRSGLWVASILALKYGKPLSTPTAFLNGELWRSLHVEKPIVKRVLLVEDDVLYGRQILRAYQQLKQAFPSVEFKTASLFVTSKAKNLIDYCCQVKNPPLLYEWTLLTNMKAMGKLAVDMDDILCNTEQKPYLVPQFPIEAIITSRLEMYRSETELWLKTHGVNYNQLLMLNLPTESDRTLEANIQHKVDALKMVKPFWYWESSPIEAEAIHSKTHIPVLCTATMELLV